jgi:hypothetical protein
LKINDLKRCFGNIAISVLKNGDTMGERMERIGQIDTDFFVTLVQYQAKNQKIRVNLPYICSSI